MVLVEDVHFIVIVDGLRSNNSDFIFVISMKKTTKKISNVDIPVYNR